MENINDTIYIESHKEFSPKSMVKCHYHSKYELYYLYEGERIYFIHDKTYHIRKGTLVLIPPNVIHATMNVKDYIYDRFLLTFSKRDIDKVISCFSNVNFFEVFEKKIHVINFPPKEQLVIEAILESMNEIQDEEKRRFLLSHLLFIANNNKGIKPKTTKADLTSTQKTITDMMSYMNNNFSNNITLKDVSEKFFLDSCYISKTFKRVVGISFVDYINNVRIIEAKKLLATSDLSIISIATSVGFKSNTHFGRVFKKINGISPLQYRKHKRTDK